MNFMDSFKRNIKNLPKVNILFILSVVWIAAMLSAWDVRQSVFLGDYISKLAIGDYWTLSNYSSWMPLAAEISEGNLFHIHSFSNNVESDFRFFPYLSLWISALLIYIFGTSGSVLFGSLIFPVFSHIFMTLIYRRYLPWGWSISLSSLGILGFSSAPFREFVTGLLMGKGWIELGVNQFPDILNFPFPSISLLSFLVLFFLSTKRTYMSRRRAILLSIFWALQIYVNIVNAIIGITFWISLLGVAIWRANRNQWTSAQTKQFLLNLVIIVFICAPVLSLILDQLMNANNAGFVASSSISTSVDWFFIGVYFVLPLVALGISYWIFRIDPSELLFRFMPIGVIMFVELTIVLLWWLFGIGVPSELLLSRLGLYFLHILYFVPSIYCMHRHPLERPFGTRALGILDKARNSISWFLKSASLIYLPLFIVLLTLFSISSSEKSFQYFKDNLMLSYQDNNKAFNLMTSGVDAESIVIGPNNLINIDLMSNNAYNSLWVNKITSKITADEAVERFALYARVIGWSESQFLIFMSPSQSFDKYSREKIDLQTSDPIPGLGYWLVFHNNQLDSSGANKYLSSLIDKYRLTNVRQGLLMNNVKRIVIDKESNHPLSSQGVVIGEYRVIDL